MFPETDLINNSDKSDKSLQEVASPRTATTTISTCSHCRILRQCCNKVVMKVSSNLRWVIIITSTTTCAATRQGCTMTKFMQHSIASIPLHQRYNFWLRFPTLISQIACTYSKFLLAIPSVAYLHLWRTILPSLSQLLHSSQRLQFGRRNDMKGMIDHLRTTSTIISFRGLNSFLG
jgi:hypothetical protein